MRNFFSGAFKDNKNLSYGFLTGILHIAQESIFSGLNNLTVNFVMDEDYDRFFGFTYPEVDVFKAATDDIIEKPYALLQGEKVIARIDQNVVYRSPISFTSNRSDYADYCK